MENVWILGGLRSFIGVKDGIYRHIPAEVLGAQVLKEIKNRFLLKDEEIDYIIGGNAVAGGGNITRLAALTAGLDEMIPAVTLDLQCGSALESITAAAAKIESGLADLVIAGGFESSSTQPVRMWNSNHPDYQEGKSYTVAKFIPDIQGEQVMLEGAEKTALTENVTKAEMDPWVLLSHKRAIQAAKEGILSDIQLSIADSKKDEGLRPSMSQRYCCGVSVFISDSERGHWYAPCSSRLYSRMKPSFSQYKPLIRSRRRPQNRNSVLVNGSSSNCCWTRRARPSMPLRRSV